MKSVLITGGCGFIPSNFVNYIVKKYPDVNFVNIDALYYCASLKNITVNDCSNYKFIKGNICSENLISHILENYQIDTVIHFAAQSHVENSFSTPMQYTKDNVFGTHNLLECVRKYGKIEKFVHCSTDEIYGTNMISDNEEGIKTEDSIICPTNPYAATKACAELLVMSYYHSFKLPVVITRGNNVYGPRQYPEKVIPRFIMLLNEGKKCTIQGDGSNVRAFIHAHDTVTAFETILHKGVIGEIYNIGCEEEFSIMDVVKILVKKMKGSDNYEEWITYIKDRNINDVRYYISNEKLKSLGWKQTIFFDEGINETIDWYTKQIDPNTHWDKVDLNQLK